MERSQKSCCLPILAANIIRSENSIFVCRLFTAFYLFWYTINTHMLYAYLYWANCGICRLKNLISYKIQMEWSVGNEKCTEAYFSSYEKVLHNCFHIICKNTLLVYDIRKSIPWFLPIYNCKSMQQLIEKWGFYVFYSEYVKSYW